MNNEERFAARIAFRLPQSLHNQLATWANEEDRTLSNLVYMLIKQAVRDHACQQNTAELAEEM